VLGRKLTIATDQLRITNKPVIDVAFELGFQNPEVFSRAFKKQFGLAPSYFRLQKPAINEIKKACVVERDIINYRGTLALKGKSVQFDETRLRGIQVKADTTSSTFKQNLKTKTEGFLSRSSNLAGFIKDRFYNVVSCSGTDDGQYNVFCGRQFSVEIDKASFKEYTIPGGWYADFIYQGDMFEIREVFVDDLYKWIMVKQAEINPNGIGMLNIYPGNYPDNNTVHILVPIKRPV
jgi:AraC family transcriptional regulator